MSKIVSYGYDAMQGSPFFFRGLGADAVTVPAGPYDLGADGRIAEVKHALAAVGQFNQGQETLWRTLTHDDVWDDDAQDEYVIFLSRWMARLACYANPLLQFSMGGAHPTFTGLLMLDAAYRYAGGSVAADVANVFTLKGCETGSASANFMPLLESFLTGKPATGDTVLLNRPGVEKVLVTPSSNVVPRPIPPPDVDATMFAQWTSVNDSIKQIWNSLTKAVTDEARVLSVTALRQARAQRDEIAAAIVAKAPPRTGTTTVENVGSCAPPQVWDTVGKRCVTPVTTAALFPAGIALALAGAAWFAFSDKKKRSSSRRRA